MSEEPNDDQEGASTSWLAFLGVVGAVLLVAIGYWAAVHYFIPVSETTSGWAHRGLFGDSFGALNALFSGLAFAGVIFALRLQMEELRLQRREMRESRAELRKSAEAQSEHVTLITEQLTLLREGALAERRRRRNEIQPIFQFQEIGHQNGPMIEIVMRNRGGLAKNLEGESSDAGVHCWINSKAVAEDGAFSATINWVGRVEPPQPLKFVIRCSDRDGNVRVFDIQTDPWEAGGAQRNFISQEREMTSRE